MSPFLRHDSRPAGSQGRIRCDGFLISCCWHRHQAASCLPWGCCITWDGKQPSDKEGPTSGVPHAAQGGAMLLRALRTPAVTPGWHIREPPCRKHALLLYELETIYPKCGSAGLDLSCVSLPAHKEENGRVCPSVSRLGSVCSCCPQRCGCLSPRLGVCGRQLRRAAERGHAEHWCTSHISLSQGPDSALVPCCKQQQLLVSARGAPPARGMHPHSLVRDSCRGLQEILCHTCTCWVSQCALSACTTPTLVQFTSCCGGCSAGALSSCPTTALASRS